VEDAFLEVVRLDPKHTRARYEIGLLLAARGDKDSGALQLRKAIELSPSLVEAHRALARLAAEAGDWPTAVSALKAALAWEPGHARTRADLAAALRASGTAATR
jgi:Flp pilus assembly protein TadD